MSSVDTQFKKGQTPWNVGIPRTLEEREKMSQNRMGTPAWNKGIPAPDADRLRRLRIGMRPWNWKGNITLLRKAIRECFEYQFWRKQIFERDNYTCLDCGARCGGGKNVILHADHIKPFAIILKENNIKILDEARSCKELWDINNGRTLCVPCHKLTPTWGMNL